MQSLDCQVFFFALCLVSYDFTRYKWLSKMKCNKTFKGKINRDGQDEQDEKLWI